MEQSKIIDTLETYQYARDNGNDPKLFVMLKSTKVEIKKSIKC